MDYTQEQRAIIARMSDLSTRYHAAVARQRDAQARLDSGTSCGTGGQRTGLWA